MIKSIHTLRVMNSDCCFQLSDNKLTAIKWDEKKIPNNVLTGRTSRVRMLGTRVGDEKSNSFKDMRAEFSWFIFPLTVFYCDVELKKVALNSSEYEVTNLDWIQKNSNKVW